MSSITSLNIVLPNSIIYGSIFIENGKISKIEKISDEKKECSKYLLPGIIDPHVHLRDPGFPQKETVETGTKAALAGGVTTIFDMPNTAPAVLSKEAFEQKKTLYEKNAQCQWKLFVSATKNNFDFLENLDDKRVAGIKIYLGSSTGDLLVEEESLIYKTFKFIARKKWVLSIHAESEVILKKARAEFKGDMTDPASHSKIRPVEAASESVKMCIDLCRKTGARINICHSSTEAELNLIEEAKKEGLPVSCEIAPHHLFLSTDDYEKFGTRVQMNPPLRSPENIEGCWEHLKKGTIDMIATDHAPHTLEEKDTPFPKAPSGIPGLETSLPLMLSAYHEGKLSLNDITKMMSANAAKIWNLNRGEIAEGKEADLIILDFSKSWKIEKLQLQTQCGWSPWENFSTPGKLEEVYINGALTKG
jgi:dihydroorotase